ncbi:MAG: shikimate dehydrogenase [Acidimicrobiales bacterium]
MGISAATRLAGVIGTPVRHSLSPALHNAAVAATGLDWVFVALEVAAGDVGRALDGARALGFGGLSVTMPHKAAAAALVDECAEDAALLGAVNCVVAVDGGRLRGENTDGGGFVDSLAEVGVDPRGMCCAVLGGGGAARAVIVALARAGAAEVRVVNRTPAGAVAAAGLVGAVGRVVDDAAGAVAGADLVVNATPVGMGDDPASPLAAGELRPGQVVADLVYEPRETPLLRLARQAGAVPVDGLGMLVHQAARAFALWTSIEAPVAAMRAAADAELATRSLR